jgi:hypothetical protein
MTDKKIHLWFRCLARMDRRIDKLIVAMLERAKTRAGKAQGA